MYRLLGIILGAITTIFFFLLWTNLPNGDLLLAISSLYNDLAAHEAQILNQKPSILLLYTCIFYTFFIASATHIIGTVIISNKELVQRSSYRGKVQLVGMTGGQYSFQLFFVLPFSIFIGFVLLSITPENDFVDAGVISISLVSSVLLAWFINTILWSSLSKLSAATKDGCSGKTYANPHSLTEEAGIYISGCLITSGVIMAIGLVFLVVIRLFFSSTEIPTSIQLEIEVVRLQSTVQKQREEAAEIMQVTQAYQTDIAHRNNLISTNEALALEAQQLSANQRANQLSNLQATATARSHSPTQSVSQRPTPNLVLTELAELNGTVVASVDIENPRLTSSPTQNLLDYLRDPIAALCISVLGVFVGIGIAVWQNKANS